MFPFRSYNCLKCNCRYNCYTTIYEWEMIFNTRSPLEKNLKMISSCSTGGWEVQDQGSNSFEFGESMFPGLQVDSFLLYPHLMERLKEKANSFKALLTRALIPFNLWSDYCLNTPPPNTIPLKIRFQHMSCEEMLFVFVLILLIFWPCLAACGVSVAGPGVDPRAPVMEVWSLNHWTARGAPRKQTFNPSLGESIPIIRNRKYRRQWPSALPGAGMNVNTMRKRCKYRYQMHSHRNQ